MMNYVTNCQRRNAKSLYRNLIISKTVLFRDKGSLIYSGNRYYHLLRCEKYINSANIIQQKWTLKHHSITNTQTRNISKSWLDDLALFQSKYFKTVSESTVVEKSMYYLQYIHDTLHIPWWLSIIISTALIRTAVTFPLSVYQYYILAKLENLRLEMDSLVKELRRETAIAIKKFNWDAKTARPIYNRSVKRMWKELIIRENCHPAKASLIVLFQLPLWLILSFSYRNMATMMPHHDTHAEILFLELSTGGFGWLPNLTDFDHSLILPVVMCLSNILIVDINSSSRIFAESKRRKYLTYFFKSISIILLPIAASVPGCMILYWTTSSICGLAQNLLLLSPRFKRSLGIPHTPSERSDPYRHLWETLQKTYLFKGEKK